jgi:hypothetical protein
MSSTLPWDNGKGTLRASQELIRPHPSQAQVFKRVNLSKRLSLEKRASLGYPVPLGLVSLQGLSHNAQLSRHQEANTVVIQGGQAIIESWL